MPSLPQGHHGPDAGKGARLAYFGAESGQFCGEWETRRTAQEINIAINYKYVQSNRDGVKPSIESFYES